MNCREYICKALAGFFLSLALGGCPVTGDGDSPPAVGHDPDSEQADVVVEQQEPETTANPTIPTVAAIKVSFKLDPHLTRGANMGDRWVSPPSFTTTRQSGKQVTVDARAVGLDYRGRLLDRRLEPEWLAADPARVSVSPTPGNRVTITMQSPGESILSVTHGEVSEILTLQAVYDEQNDMAHLVISRGGPD